MGTVQEGGDAFRNNGTGRKSAREKTLCGGKMALGSEIACQNYGTSEGFPVIKKNRDVKNGILDAHL